MCKEGILFHFVQPFCRSRKKLLFHFFASAFGIGFAVFDQNWVYTSLGLRCFDQCIQLRLRELRLITFVMSMTAIVQTMSINISLLIPVHVMAWLFLMLFILLLRHHHHSHVLPGRLQAMLWKLHSPELRASSKSVVNKSRSIVYDHEMDGTAGIITFQLTSSAIPRIRYPARQEASPWMVWVNILSKSLLLYNTSALLRVNPYNQWMHWPRWDMGWQPVSGCTFYRSGHHFTAITWWYFYVAASP